MIKKAITLFFLTFTLINIQGQSIKNIHWVKDSTKIVMHYDLVSFIKGNTFNVEIFCSSDGGETYNIPLRSVIGDVGSEINLGKNKSVVWDVFKDIGGLAGQVSFRIIAAPNPRKRDYYISYSGSLEAPIGFQIGMIGGLSPYIGIRLNKDFNAQKNYEYDENTLIKDYPYSDIYFIYGDNVKKPRFSITAGANAQVFNKAFAYAGLGFGKSTLLWEVNEYEYKNDELIEVSWAQNNKWSITGLELEAGIILPIKDITLNLGTTVTNFRRPGLTFGLGYKFN